MTDRFPELVDAWVLAAVLAGPTSFDDLVCHLPGIYPTEVRASLGRLRSAQEISFDDYDRAIARRPIPPQSPQAMGLSVPHPLDFDWRFSDGGLDTVLDVVDELEPSGELLCLGAPSVVRRLQLDKSARPATLVDANPLPVAAIGSVGTQTAVLCRLGSDALPALLAPATIIDPPWYPEYFDVFLWAAAHLTSVGGHVLVSFPAAGTRPGVREERDMSLARAAALGLVLEEIRRFAVGYRSPPFERAALEAADLPSLPSDWRRGDLLILKKEAEATGAGAPADLGQSEWAPISASPTQIRVRLGRDGPVVDPRLVAVVDGDVLPSVSRRDPARDAIDVWTANQRVYRCEHTAALTAVASAVCSGTSSNDAVASCVSRELSGAERSFVAASTDQLRSLIEQETADLRRHRWLEET